MTEPKEIELVFFLAYMSLGLLTGAALIVWGYFHTKNMRRLHGN